MAEALLKKYAEFSTPTILEELRALVDKLKGLRIQEINSTRRGGGCAEMLTSLVAFLKELGFDVRWDVIEAEPEFFRVTKTLHNFLQGKDGFSPSMINIYWDTLRRNAEILSDRSDAIVIHDPQPAGLIEFLEEEKRRRVKIVWRCHVHLETVPLAKMKEVEHILRRLIEKYDAAVFSTFHFLPLWDVLSFVIPPFIDPLSDKNVELSQEEVNRVLSRYGLDLKKPLITQVSRFDYFKDPLGVIAAFKKVREKMPCQLLLVGGGASDDPEYQAVLADVRMAAQNNPDIHILDLPADSHREINAFQRASSIILQKSIKEGFGLTVTEGLWKAKPVVAGRVGGILLQIRDGWNGFLVSTVDEAAERIQYLLKNPKVAEEMGKRGREFVKEHYLLPRGARCQLAALNQLINGYITSKRTILSYHPWIPLS
ncbi:MAG: glycosyltransferase [Nitrososphaerales archaeon]